MTMNFTEKRLSNSKARNILKQNGISVNQEEVNCILELMYLMSINFKKPEYESEPNLNKIPNYENSHK